WPPAVCGPTWTATYPPAERGFRECDVVATGDITLREAPEEGSRAIVERARNTVLYVIGHRGEWLEVLANEERGWVPAAQTRDECRPQECARPRPPRGGCPRRAVPARPPAGGSRADSRADSAPRRPLFRRRNARPGRREE